MIQQLTRLAKINFNARMEEASRDLTTKKSK